MAVSAIAAIGSSLAASAGSAVAWSAASAFAISTTTFAMISAATSFVVMAGVGAITRAALGKPQQQSSLAVESQARTQVVRSAVANHQVIYGTVVVSGPLVFASSSGTNNEYLHLVIALAGHQVTSINEIWLGEDALGALDASGAPSSGPYARHVRVKIHLGHVDQAADLDLIAESPEWTAAHRLRGIAYIYVRLRFDAQLFPSGLPNIKASVTRNLSAPNPAYGAPTSNNFALAVRDYLANHDYGLGCGDDEIDEAGFITSASVSDSMVATYPGATSTERQYLIDGAFDTGLRPLDVLNRLLSGGAGTLTYSQGRYRLTAGAWINPVTTITADDLRGPLSVRPRVPRSSLFNAVRGTYLPIGGQVTDFPMQRDDAYIGQDGGVEIPVDIELPFTSSVCAAQRISRQHLDRSRQGITVDFPGKLTCAHIPIDDIILLDMPLMGWSQKPFRVKGWTLAGDGMGVDLTLQEESAASYAWDGSTNTVVDAAPDTGLVAPTQIAAPTGLTLASESITQPSGAHLLRLNASWVAPASAWVDGYDVAWRENGGPWDTARTQDARFSIAVAIGRAYEVRVRARSVMSGVTSTWATSASATPLAPTTGPAAPTASAAGALFSVGLAWTFGDGRNDIRATEVWYAASNDRGAATRLTSEPFPARVYQHPGLSPGVGGYYWLRVVDVWGNASAWHPTSPTSGLHAVASTDPTSLLTQLQGSLGVGQLAAELVAPIAAIPGQQTDLRKLDRAADTAAEAALHTMLKLAEVDRTMSDAGIVTNPDTGEVYIYGLRESAGRMSSVELRLDGAEANINLKASIFFVNQAIATAVIDPSQVAALGDIYLRLATAEADINGAEASITLKASQTEVNGINGRLVTAESEIDALQGQIVLKAETATVNAIDARLNTAEATLNRSLTPSPSDPPLKSHKHHVSH